MTTALEHIRYSCGIAGEEVANYVDELERVVSLDSSLIDELRAKLAAAQEEMRGWRNKAHQLLDRLEDQHTKAEWQPISTAPKDGTVFLGYKLGQFRECYKVPRDDCDMWCFGGTSGADDLFPNIKPTHWMPLPKAPNGASS